MGGVRAPVTLAYCRVAVQEKVPVTGCVWRLHLKSVIVVPNWAVPCAVVGESNVPWNLKTSPPDRSENETCPFVIGDSSLFTLLAEPEHNGLDGKDGPQ